MQKSVFLFTIFSLFQIIIYGQRVCGTVLAETGFGAADITVSFKDKDNKILTKADGSFEIMATKLPDTLTFTAPGFEPYTVVVTEETVKDPDFEVVLLKERAKYTFMHDMAPAHRVSGDVKYDTVLTFDPETYEEKITIVRSDGSPAESVSDFAYGGKRDYAGRKSPGALSAPSETIVNGKKFCSTKNLVEGKKEVYEAGLLTAAEVNDFQKWNLWEDISENEFEKFQEEWGLSLKNRFCVQLKNKNNEPLVGEPISLVNSTTGETVWKAVSDNTGKAELWSDIFENSSQATDFQLVGKDFRINNPSDFQTEINHVKLNRGCNISSEVDMAFVVDATGSMSDELEFLKVELEQVIQNTFSEFSDLDLRASSVFYRDQTDEYVTNPIDFQKDLLKILNFIKLQKAKGGGDYPESLTAAMEVAVNEFSWRENTRTKLLFIVSDAPPHKENKEKLHRITEKAAEMGIRIIPLACSGTNQSNEFLLRSLALATNGTYTTLTNNSSIGNTKLAPTTDEFEVELLSDLLARLTRQFIYVKPCEEIEILDSTLVQKFNVGKTDLEIKLYPNPTSGQVNLKFNQPVKAVYLADFTGKILDKITESETKKIKFNIKNYPSGNYLIRYITEGNQWGAEQFVFMR